MPCFMIVFSYLLFVHGSEGITTHSVTGCSASAVLNCSNTEMIHVERITYYNITDCNQNVTVLQVCGQPMTGSETGLVPSCNGNIYPSYCPGTRAAKVDYRCITGNDVIDMCDEFSIQNTNRTFLSTPLYPSRPTFTDINVSPCRCSIRGSSITSIQILELVLQTSNDGTKSSVEINYGDVTYKTESFSDTSSTRRVYNKRLSPTSTTAEIILNHNNINRQYIWIEVQGVSIRVSCNKETNEKDATTSSSSPTLTSPTTSPATSSLLPSTSTSPTLTIPSSPSSSTTPTSPTSSQSVPEEPNIEPSSSTDSSSSTAHPPQTADITSHSQDKDTINITLAVLLPLCLLMMCITALIIIVLLRREKLIWVKKPPQVERERNPYSGLDRTQRVSGSDGTYQELNTMNLTPQYNNVSQNNHRDYYNLN